MALPFGLGAAVSAGLYKLQNEPDISFSSFLLFLGVAMSITAFPVLARILAELKLLRTNVGAITMASGLINDCTAWVLLALVVALMNSSGGIEALYVFLTAVGFTLFVLFIIGPLYRKLCHYTQSYENGPSPLLMTVTLMMVMISAFVTNIIGIHAIFGGFLAGVIVPHENDLSIKITEKIEDMVNIVFLPLYFTLSGLKTQIGLLDSGAVWGYVILVIFLACFGKIVGCTAAAKLCGMTYRESFTVGFLMNCKGLVELIVLNIGHDAGVLNDQIFVIMVMMALITTFMTTPGVIYLYPEWYQKQQQQLQHHRESSSIPSNSIDVIVHEKGDDDDSTSIGQPPAYCLVSLINHIELTPSMMTLMQLLYPFQMYALRLLELTQRTSTVMTFKKKEFGQDDVILNVLRTFSNMLLGRCLETHLDFCNVGEIMKTVANYGQEVHADMILIPVLLADTSRGLEWVQEIFSLNSSCDVGVWVDRGSFGQSPEETQIAVVLSKESRATILSFVLQLLKQRNEKKIKLTVLSTEPDDWMTTEEKSYVAHYLVFDHVGSIATLLHTRPYDLIIVGRPQQQQEEDEKRMPITVSHRSLSSSSSMNASQQQQDNRRDYEAAFGFVGAQMLLQEEFRNTSVLVVQAKSESSS
ncbi:MAG: Sodium/hydrogen exchanger family-domain-containing protein [Benjaminiella poitrasii]|nr:MAG: Sodium/hydrogen exchanger family-domain-containing protein [Benjaminiella poitrasii]